MEERMDKYEFNIKVEQIKKLVNKKDFATAMKIADTIDWRRVRNANLLSMISQVYEKNSEYQEAKEVLLLAFERAPIGKRLLYKLTELALKEGSLAEAEDYYREFCDLAPEDTRQHILRYMILREKDAPVDQLIHSLERYTNAELDEKRMYELAELYAKAGRSADCVQLCDKMILLFGIGTYVERATDLRQRYAPRNTYQGNTPQNAFNSSNMYGGGAFGGGNVYGESAYGAGSAYEGGSYGTVDAYEGGYAEGGNGYENGAYGGAEQAYGGGSPGSGNAYENGSYGSGSGYEGGFYGSGNAYEGSPYEAGNGQGVTAPESANNYGGVFYGPENGYVNDSPDTGSAYGQNAFGSGDVYVRDFAGTGNTYGRDSFGNEGAYADNQSYGAPNSFGGGDYSSGAIRGGVSPYGNEAAYGGEGFYTAGNTNENIMDTQSEYGDEAGYDMGYNYGNQTPYEEENGFRNHASSYGSDSSYEDEGAYEANSQPYKSYPASGGYIVDEEMMANLHQAAAEKELAAEMSRISTEIYEEPEPVSNQTRVFHGKNNIRYLRPRVEEEKPYYSRTYTPHHMIIEAKTAEEGFEKAVEALKKIHQETGITNQAIKITGSKLGQRGIINVSDKLAGKDLIVEEAGDLTQRDLEELQMLLERDETGMIVVLIDNPFQIEELHQQNPGFINLFKCIGSGEHIEEPEEEVQYEQAQNDEVREDEEADLPESGQEVEAELSAEDPEEDRQGEELEEEPENEPVQEPEPEEEEEPEAQEDVRGESWDEEPEEDISDAGDDVLEPEEPDEEFYEQEDYDDEPLDEEDLSNGEDQDGEESDIEADGDEEGTYEDEYEEFDAAAPVDDDEEMEIEAFADYAVQYANEIDCSITGKSMLALYERVDAMEENGIPLTRANAEDMIEEAADRAEKPSIGGLLKGVFSSKYDKEGLLILKEEHFL